MSKYCAENLMTSHYTILPLVEEDTIHPRLLFFCIDIVRKFMRWSHSKNVKVRVFSMRCYICKVIQVIHEWQFGRTRNNVETCKCRSGILFPLLFQVLSNFASITTEKAKSLVHFDYQQMYYFTLSLSMSVVILPGSPHPTPLPVN